MLSHLMRKTFANSVILTLMEAFNKEFSQGNYLGIQSDLQKSWKISPLKITHYTVASYIGISQIEIIHTSIEEISKHFMMNNSYFSFYWCVTVNKCLTLIHSTNCKVAFLNNQELTIPIIQTRDCPAFVYPVKTHHINYNPQALHWSIYN